MTDPDSAPFLSPVAAEASMSLRVRERLGLADVVTLINAVLGLAAITAAFTASPGVVARLILLAAVADGLDGIIARRRGGTAVGPYLDSLADVVSFGTAPAVFVFAVAYAAWSPLTANPAQYAIAIGVPALFVVLSLVRTGLYTVYVGEDETRPGIQNTLAASILAAGYLAGVTDVWLVLAAAVVLSILMVAPVPYPKLLARDALVMGVVQVGAILRPSLLERAFPRMLLLAALAYLVLAPRYYWAE